MSDPYQLHSHIKFVAPYSLQTCRQRILENLLKTPTVLSGGFDSSISNNNLNSNKLAFKMRRTARDRSEKIVSYMELNGTLTHLSDDETLVAANFKLDLSFLVAMAIVLIVGGIPALIMSNLDVHILFML